MTQQEVLQKIHEIISKDKRFKGATVDVKTRPKKKRSNSV